MQPVLVLHIHDVQLFVADVVGDEPGVKQTLTDEAEDAAVVGGVASRFLFLW